VLLNNYPNLNIIELSFVIADTAARLRAEYRLKTPDAIIFATALHTNSKYFLTNDLHLKNVGERESMAVLLIDEL
jgi:predicted nucleic acid-binding protein